MYRTSQLQPQNKEALRLILTDDLGFDDTVVVSLSKQQLIDTIMSAEPDTDPLNVVDDDEDDGLDIALSVEAIIANFPTKKSNEEPSSQDQLELEEHITKYDSGWTDHVLSQLFDHELQEGYPTATGLRRIFEVLVGPILQSEVRVVQCPLPENERRAVVEYTLGYVEDDHNKTITDAADCFYGNSSKPFVYYAVATATTIAEGRCLRKALGIRVLTQEELDKPLGIVEEIQESEGVMTKISENQKHIIQRMADRLNIDLITLIKYDKLIKTSDIDNFNQEEARMLLRALSSYQRGSENGGSAIPDSLLKSNDKTAN